MGGEEISMDVWWKLLYKGESVCSALAHNEYRSNSSRGENEHSEAQVNVLSWKKLNECNCYVSRIVYTFWALQREYSCLLLTLTNSEKSTIRFKTYPTCFWWMWPSFCPFSNFKMLIISSWDSHYRDKSHHYMLTEWLDLINAIMIDMILWSIS